VATDGRRLALFESDLEFPKSNERDFILPTKAVTELQRLLGDEGEVIVSSSNNLVSFQLNGSQLVSKLVEGNYPNYRQVIPGEAKERIPLEREALLNCVRRVALLSSDKTSSLRLSFTKNNLDITATTPEVGEAKESMSVNYRGRDIAIAFNPEFLMDPLRNLPNDEVYLELIDEMSPGVLKIQTPFLYVIMPMRVSA
jgi:DNA polymerase-3 subunit beta